MQTFHLELYDMKGHSLQNATDDDGQFYLPEVADDKNITLVIYATNVRGRSQTKTLHLATLAPTLALGIFLILLSYIVRILRYK